MLIIGALGDWISTKLGLSIGFMEGNHLAAYFMSRNMWMQVDSILILVCFSMPFLVSHFSKEEAPRSLFWFPLIAGILKLGVSLWNISVIFV
jgi:hypothetical protein